MSKTNASQTSLGVIKTDHAGISLLVSADAYDHCTMRAAQLSALLKVVSGTGVESFLGQDQTTQDGVLWLASSLADEVQRMLPLVEAEVRRRPRDGGSHEK